MIDFAKLKKLTIPEGPVARLLWGGKVLWQKKRNLLPAGYTLLDYIESDGNQYLVTDFCPSNKSRVIADLQFTSTGAQSRVFSALTSDYYFDFYINTSKKLAFNAGTDRTNTNTGVSANTKRHLYEIDCHTAKVDGNVLKTLTASAGQSSHSLVLFARRTGDGSTITYLDSPTKARLYSVEAYEDGILVCNLVPCMSPAGEIGMYDRVNGVFYGNSGTGAFTYGHAFVEYIESTGTQYIDTGFVADSNCKVAMDCQSVGVGTMSSAQAFFGARTGTTSECFAVYWHKGDSSYRYYYGASHGSKKLDRITERIIITADKNVATFGDAVTLTRPIETFTGTHPIYLFAMNNGGEVMGATKLRVYSCKIYDGTGALVRDYIPCINHNGEAGMYDRVNGVFYGNAGTGEFIGPEVDVADDGAGNISLSGSIAAVDDGMGNVSVECSTFNVGDDGNGNVTFER